jgi:hypothetical protein
LSLSVAIELAHQGSTHVVSGSDGVLDQADERVAVSVARRVQHDAVPVRISEAEHDPGSRHATVTCTVARFQIASSRVASMSSPGVRG